MPRTNLDINLRELQSLIIGLDQHVEDALARTLSTLENGDHSILSAIINNAPYIKALSAASEKQALRLLIIQQPLGGQDLRFLTAALHISLEFGRVEDAIVQVAETLLRAGALYRQAGTSSAYSTTGQPVDLQGHLTEVFILRGMLLLGREVQYILQQTMIAFAQRNAAIARTIRSEQDLVDLRYTPVCQDIMEMQAQISMEGRGEPFFIQRITYLLWIAHKLAEIATHAIYMCKQIIFIVEG